MTMDTDAPKPTPAEAIAEHVFGADHGLSDREVLVAFAAYRRAYGDCLASAGIEEAADEQTSADSDDLVSKVLRQVPIGGQ